jgi:hypothetical protein
MVEWVSWIQNLQYSLKAEQKAEIQIKKGQFYSVQIWYILP